MLTKKMKARLKLFLQDDLGQGDITSQLISNKNCTAIIQVKETCTLAGLDELVYLFSLKKCKVKLFAKDGQFIKKGKTIAEIKGNNHSILGIERTALNVLSRMSGVATTCAHARKIIGKSKIQIALTRKTLPGFNLLDKKSAVLAGVYPHRLNLSSAILIKDNHLKFFPNVLEATVNAKQYCKGKKVE
ncbi:MAG: carboxylating.nicotinate-nucleotide diphosphorylase, partial [Candidatus Diapherotrites archaeon]|nr:carboxylating.nicotinate-nucleotide diphosphorylase [Candidatus Diapherotrites archaeon]